MGFSHDGGEALEKEAGSRRRHRTDGARGRDPRHGTSSTTGTTGSCTRAATCGRSTWCTTRASATTCRRRSASPWPTRSERSFPQGALCLAGFQPSLISSARGINLIYQFWIHTEAIGRLGAFEKVLNTPSHHRVHHGVNPQYIDRNHGSILIIWDRLFGTFEPEGERVVYGLTRNIKTFNPLRIAAHEHREMLSDVQHSRGWRERLSYVVRGPGWAYSHRERSDLIASSPAA